MTIKAFGMKGVYLFSTLLALSLVSLWACTDKEQPGILYVQNTMDGLQNAPRTPGEKALLLKKTGFDGLEGGGYDDFFELKKVLTAQNLSMPVNYVPLNFREDLRTDNPSLEEIREMIRHTERNGVLYFHLHSEAFKDNPARGDSVVSAIFRGLAEYAEPFGVKLCTYPHIFCYCETVEHSIRLAKMTDRQNYGVCINLCHLLKVEGTENMDRKIREAAPYLFAVNICGADDGDTQAMGWDRLIQPLGEGTFDTYRFLKTIWDNGYRGPIGIQCFNLTGDAEMTLQQTRKVWNDYKNRYKNEP